MSDTDRGRRYREIRRLDEGAMATSVLAEDTVLGRRVALKRLQGSDVDGERLKRQTQARASISHPNLVFVYDIQIEHDGELVIVMEHLAGETLSEVIVRRGALMRQEALHVLHGVAAALDVLHAKGLIHGHVEPASIVLSGDGTVKLADPGLAGVSPHAPAGSRAYMPPEQLEGAQPTAAADVHALAAVAYEVLSGEKARQESRPGLTADAGAAQPPPDLRGVWPEAPAVAAGVLKRGMATDPRERPSSAGELVAGLERALKSRPAAEGLRRTGTAPAASPAPAAAALPAVTFAKPEAQPDTRRRRPTWLVPALAAAAALLVGVVAAVALTTGGGKQPLRGSPRVLAARTRPATAKQPATAGPPVTLRPGTSGGSHQAPNSSPSTSDSQPVTPSGAVEAFYEAAAAHQYPAAWALADPNMRNEVGGLESFQSEMSPVRSIAFHRAEVLGGYSGGSATVELETTSVQTDRTQQCAGTVDTVRSGQVWLLHGISISCT